MVATEYAPDFGDLIKMDFDPGQAGHEEAGWRPALVVSPRHYNKTVGLALVVPITSQIKDYPFEVNLPAGLKIGGTILSDAIKSIDWRARKARLQDKAPADVMKQVQAKLAALLGLPQP
jgi:mRNA interferase MazF